MDKDDEERCVAAIEAALATAGVRDNPKEIERLMRVVSGWSAEATTVQIGDYRPAFSPSFRDAMAEVDRWAAEGMAEYSRQAEDRLVRELRMPGT